MSHNTPVNLSSGLGETVLPEADHQEREALALAVVAEEPRVALGELVKLNPQNLDAWAYLSRNARDEIERYAYARVGYHRGLDQLRKAGWRGSGYVRWEHESNRGFLRALEGLQLAALAIGETEEAERCELFLKQCDPKISLPLD